MSAAADSSIFRESLFFSLEKIRFCCMIEKRNFRRIYMDEKLFDIKKYALCARACAAEGTVLLKNDREALPLSEGTKLAVFGRSQFHYYKSGTGSGGLVNTDYVTGIYEALEASNRYEINQKLRGIYESWLADHPFDEGEGWASEPWVQEEMPLSESVVSEAAAESETALVIIGRTAGEDQDNQNAPGSFLLTEKEREMLRLVCSDFPRTVVLLNTGNIIDMGWVEELDPAAVAYVWQGGQEGGNGVLDVLSGTVSPSGCLPDTIARNYSCYPSAEHFGSPTENIQAEDIFVGYRYFETFAPSEVLYPFGFGMSYTSFSEEVLQFSYSELSGISLTIRITNTGNFAGKHVVQVYGSAPQGRLGKSARVLLAFQKTGILAPGDSQTLSFAIPLTFLASYDDSGATGHRSAFVLEEGCYRIFAGSNVRSASEAGRFDLPGLLITEQEEEALAPVRPFERLRPVFQNGTVSEGWESVPLQTVSPAVKRSAGIPECLPCTGDKGWKLKDVADGRVSMEAFLAQLDGKDLCSMMRGEGMCSPKVTPGIAGAFGGVTDRLRSFGIPVAGCSDGPSGIRMDCGTHAFSLPNGTCLASTFNEALNEELFTWEGLELRRNRIDMLLGPGMNIHRNPLNGRNFEYFSEDPVLTGKIASAQLRGLHAHGVTGVIKHFAGNTQEYQRHYANAVVSERALREIYLRGFELAVREGNARAVMSTYGPVNGLWTSGSYDLLTTILRKEWGFTGIVMTDWWAMANDAPGEKGSYQNVSAQVRAQNDINMVNADAENNSNGDDLEEALASGRLTRAELVRNAANICRFLLTTPAWLHSIGAESELDRVLETELSQDETRIQNIIPVRTDKPETMLMDTYLCEKRGETVAFTVATPHRSSFQLRLEARCIGNKRMSQHPVSVFMDRELLKTFSLTGADTDWKQIDVPVHENFNYSYFLKFYFAQSGVELRSIRLIQKEDLEEQILKAMRTSRRENKE